MGVYISNLRIPKDEYLPINIYPDGRVACRFDANCANAIEIPPHGKLIDADAFIAEQQHLYCENCAKRKGMKNGKMKFVYGIGDAPCRSCGIMDVLDSLEDAPTIILTSEEGE